MPLTPDQLSAATAATVAQPETDPNLVVPDQGTQGTQSPDSYNEPSTLLSAADLQAQADGTASGGILDRASDFVTKGVPLIGASIVNSFVNTPIELGNFFGADNQKLTIQDEFGEDSPTTSYYQRNQGLVEGAGLAVGSLLPGLGAIKVLKLAQTGEFGEAVSSITGLFSGIKEDALATAKLDSIENAASSSLFGARLADTTKAVLAGAGDQFLQGAVYQIATLATMKASPLLDNNTIGDNVKDVITSGLGFGIIGGTLDAISDVSAIRKAVLGNDLASKPSQIVGSQGLGNLTPGDRILGVYEQKFARPTPVTPSEIQNEKFATDVDNRLLSQHFDELAGGDTEVANAMRSFIDDAVFNKGLRGDDLAQQIGQAAKIGRIDDESIASVNNNAFFVPQKIDVNTIPALMEKPNTILQATQNPAEKLAKAFAPTGVPIKIGHAFESDTFSNLVNQPLLTPFVPKYKGAQDAYAKGVDIFIDAKGGTHINPGSDALEQVARPGESRVLKVAEAKSLDQTGNLPTGAKPLNTPALFINLKDGTITGEQPLSVVGDFGNVKAVNFFGKRGLTAGEGDGQQFFPEKRMIGDVTQGTPLQANAEYVYRDMLRQKEGIEDGTSIHPTDLPSLEAAYKDMRDHETKDPSIPYSDEKELSFSEPYRGQEEFPQTASELAQHIQQVKMDIAADLMGEGKSSDEVAQRINAPEKFITQGPSLNDVNSWMIPSEQHTSINTIRVAYDISHVAKDEQGNILRGMQATSYRYQLAEKANTDAMASYLAKTAGTKASQYFSNLKITKTVDQANIFGAGEGLVTAANGGYGSLAEQVERVGRSFQELNLLRQKAVNEALAPSLLKIKNDPKLAAEWGNFIFVRRSTPETYEFISPDLAQKYNLPENTVVLQGALEKKAGVQTDFDPDYRPKDFIDGRSNGTGLKTWYELSPELRSLEEAHAKLLGFRNDIRDNFLAAQGLPGKDYDPSTLYVPPINTARQPFFAIVKEREGYAMSEGGSQMIVAKNAQELRQKISLLPDKYVAITKTNSEEYFKAQGQYDFNRNFTSLKIKSDLAKSGVLTGLLPETRASNLIDDLLTFHRNQETQLLRDHIEIHNAKLFSQLDAMGEKFIQTANSSVGNISRGISKQLAADNPYATYTRTALGVSSKDQYPFWNSAQEKVTAFADQAFNKVAEALGALQRGIITPEEANKVSQKFGLGNPYGEVINSLSKAQYYGGLVNKLPSPNILGKVVGTANTILGATVIRLDALQQLVHAVTLPIMASLEYGGATNQLAKSLSVTIPGTQTAVPAFSKVMYQAIKNFWGPESEKLTSLYSSIGMPRDQIFAIKRMVNELSFPATSTNSATWLQKIQNASTIAEKYVGTKFVNEFNHFIAADIGRQLGEIKGLTGQDLLDHIGTFSNRVLGNLTAGQRGAIFHGPVGQAIGLFQSYQFNLMQQVFRNVAEGNTKAVAMAAGLQSSIFGLSSLPGFHALNTLIQTHDGNSGGQDLYSTSVRTLGKSVSDYLLYGSLSGISGAALYSRGDINPRRATIIPTNPLDIPTVATGIRVYQNMAQFASNISKGAPIGSNLLLALEHNGLSRPLSGLAEMMQGYSTDTKGNLISNSTSNSAGWSDLVSLSNMSRLLGAKPLDEAITLDTMYRNNSAKQAETQRIQNLGQAVKSSLYNQQKLNPEQFDNFAQQYAATGGNINNFNRQVLDWTNKAHVPAANALFKHISTSPRAKNAFITMGGIPLPQYQAPLDESGNLQP